jgi:hypothetical protein
MLTAQRVPVGPIPADCNRTCLEGLINQYLTAVLAHDPKGLPLSADVKYTEQEQIMAVGDGFWKTVTGRGAYNHYFADPVAGQAGWMGTMREKAGLLLMTVRLRVQLGRITEIENRRRSLDGRRRLHRASWRERLCGGLSRTEVLCGSRLTANTVDHFLKRRDASVNGNVTFHLQIAIPHVVHVRVLPPVDFPRGVVKIALNQQPVLLHVSEQALRHMAVRYGAIDVDGHRGILELKPVLDCPEFQRPRRRSDRIGIHSRLARGDFFEKTFIAFLRDDRQSGSDRLTESARVIEMVMRHNHLRHPLAGHNRLRFLNQGPRPRLARRKLEQREVIREFEQDRVGAASSRQ